MTILIWAVVVLVALYVLLPPVLWLARMWTERGEREAFGSVGNYTFAVNGSGRIVNPDGKHQVMSDDAIEHQVESIRGELSEGAPAGEPKRILVHIHGGLQPLHHSRANALRRYERIKNAGYRPLFVNWESGPLATYWEHLFRVRAGRRQPRLALATYPFVFLADVLRGVAGAPNSLIRRLYTYLFRRQANKPVEALNEELVRRVLAGHGPAIVTSIGSDSRSMGSRSGRLLGWLIPRTVSILTGAFVEGPGTAAWQNMQRRTTTTFRKPREFDLAERANSEGVGLEQATTAALDSKASGGFSRLIKELCDLTSVSAPGGTAGRHEQLPNSEYEITLVGHSMGAIIANRILREHPHLPIKQVVYMGAACSIRDCFDAVLPFIDGQEPEQRATFYNLSLHPEAERRERNAMDLVPRGSLLEWIDDMFESPRAFLDRRVGKWENVMQATHLVPEHLRGHVKLKAFGVGPEATGDPQMHGEFDNKRFWEQSYWEPVRQQPVPAPASAAPGSTAASGGPSASPPTTLSPTAVALDEAVSLDESMPQQEPGSPNEPVPQGEERADVGQPR